MSNNTNLSLLSKTRAVFWPVYGHEFKKFIPMSFLMFFVLFNQNILRILKPSATMVLKWN